MWIRVGFYEARYLVPAYLGTRNRIWPFATFKVGTGSRLKKRKKRLAWFQKSVMRIRDLYFGSKIRIFSSRIRIRNKEFIVQVRVSDPDPYLDPDPHGPALSWAAGSGSGFKLRIRIRIQEDKNDPQKKKISRIFMFLSTGCTLLMAEGFSCSLGVLYGGLGISILQFLIKK